MDGKGDRAACLPDVDLSKPRYDQRTYVGRVKYFWETTSVLNVFASKQKLEASKQMLENYQKYQKGELPPDAIKNVTEEELWRAKALKESAYHPDTGKLVPVYGRMSFQLPGNTLITGLMMVFHKNPWHVGAFQFMNQSYNAISFYCNRSGPDPISERTILKSFVAATGIATTIALGLNNAIKRRNLQGHIIGKFVAYAAVVAANCTNNPIMRRKELREGIPVVDNQNEEIGRSKIAACKAIRETVTTRILIASTVMVIPPVIVHALKKQGVIERVSKHNLLNGLWKVLEKGRLLKTVDTRVKFVAGATEILLVGASFVFAVPFSCAAYPQMRSISLENLEPSIRERAIRISPSTKTLTYNRGL